MSELWASPYFGIALSILAFWAGEKLQKKLKSPFCNPLLIAILIIVIILLVFDIPYDSYNEGGAVINMFLAPATACLAVSIYTKLQLLKENAIPILVGCTAGSLSSMGSVYVLCKLFGLDEAMTASLLPKSITTAIGMGLSEELGGYVTITVAVIVVTGVLGNIMGEAICKIFRITDPIAKGLSFGASAHAIGTAKAMELGEVEGAMSSLAIAVTGLLTVVFSSVFAGLL